MKQLSKKNIAIFQMLVCASLWSIAGVMFKFIPWNSFVIAGARGFVAGLVVLAYIGIRKLPIVINARSLKLAVGMCLTCSFFVAANKLTTAANAIVLQFTSPVFILVFSALFRHKRFSAADIICVAVTLAGMALFFLDQLASGYMLGNLLAICAGASMAVMFIAIGDATEPERYSGILMCQILIALIGLPFAFTTEIDLSARPLILIIVLGVFQLGIPYILLSKASEHCPPLACSILGALEPLLNPVWVLIFYGERPGIFALIGGIVVIFTVTVWCVYSDRHPAAEAGATEV